ncbi:DMT family transporter [Asticcacaulis machinosus]|uniref:EamA family transporter n=1 Tax=Asticcacaulis machinosus TaxID=2984211 RepID=A0ABT5HGV6_9CAUL|nr:EamA family transporter [Asticcacaulis machinosus]MDC7675423.1 EamA family transporter [Asticcacaulis machinosus]
MKISPVQGYGLAFLSALLWGVSGTLGQFLFEHKGINVGWLVAVRMLIAGVLFLGFVAARHPRDIFRIWRTPQDARRMLAFGLLGMLAVQYTYFAAIEASNAATATVIQYVGPVMIAAWFALKEKRWPSPLEVLSIVLAVAGVYFLVTHGDLSTLNISPIALFWGLSSALALAFYSIQPIALMHKYRAPLVIGWGMLIGGGALAVVYPPWQVSGVWDAETYGFMAFIIVFGTLVPFYAYLTAVKVIGARISSLMACAEPLAATVLAVIWLGVSFGAYEWIGTACILGTILLLTLRRGPQAV